MQSPHHRRYDAQVSPRSASRAVYVADVPPTTGDSQPFGGPLGSALLIILLPVMVVGLNAACEREGVYMFRNLSFWDLLNSGSLHLALSWIAFQFILARVLPGDSVPGLPVNGRPPLLYKINGHLAFWVSLLVVLHALPYTAYFTSGAPSQSPRYLSRLYTIWTPLCVVSIVIAYGLSVILYIASFRKLGGKQQNAEGSVVLSEGGSTGNMLIDFFMGRELNPRLGTMFDLKFFFEMRPGIIGWCVANVCFAYTQYESYGRITPEMALVVLFQGIYVWDALYHERAVLSTMDITTEGFGLMLVFGVLVWIPFIFTIQARYLVHQQVNYSFPSLAAITALKLIGYTIFRLSNNQKDLFRRAPADPRVSQLRSFQTASGRRLLVDGWWGLARKINYTGDWLMGLSWCLLCGFSSPIPYFYAVYFLVLLLHRAWRDDYLCSRKYADDWKRYKRSVPWLFIPYIL